MFKKFGVVGSNGMVGGALMKWLRDGKREVYGYDIRGESDSQEQIAECDLIFICTPTPYRDGHADISSVEETVEWIMVKFVAQQLNEFNPLKSSPVIVIKSTVPPGTTAALQDKYPNAEFMMNPEFLTEATCDNDMTFPDRQILGVTLQSKHRVKEVFLNLPLANYEAIVTTTEAEIIKYFGNNWFVFKVLLANMWFEYCEKVGASYEAVKEAVAADKRIERTHLTIHHKNGRGASGGCLPKDLAAALAFMSDVGLDVELYQAAKDMNDELCFHTGKTDTKGMYDFAAELRGDAPKDEMQYREG